MSNQKYPHLFSPVQAGGVLFRNRIFAAPMGVSYVESDGFLMPEVGAFYERKAIGGAASVCISGGGVSRRGMAYGGGMIAYQNYRSRPFYTYVTNSITRHGCMASLELQHGGIHATQAADLGMQIYGPMEADYKGYHALPMTEEIIQETIDDFVKGAKYAKSVGFGMVTIHGGHGWLIHQFMSPISNTRTDRWGGSLENRLRLPREICKAIKKEVPGMVVELRISGHEGTPEGYDIEEGIRMAKGLDGYPDILHISAGNSAFTVTHPSMFQPDGMNVKLAAAIKPHIHQSKIATVGALSDPEYLEEIIASGQADIVEMARGLTCDPDLPNKARTGRTDDINTCLRCNHCYSEAMGAGQFCCTLNPQVGREEEYSTQPLAAEPKNVIVIGGGIGGMQAAITAAKRGHSVKLYEKSDRLGGVLLCEDKVPFKKHLAEYIEKQIRRLHNSGAEVHIGETLTPEQVEALHPDVVIAAIGGKAAMPPIPGIEKAIPVTEAYSAPEKLGKKVVILGGGMAGTELSVYLHSLGKEPAIAEMADKLNFASNTCHAIAVNEQLTQRGIAIHTGAKVTAIKDGCVECETAGGTITLEADSIVNALGRLPLQEEAAAYALSAPVFYAIGDCLAAKTVYEANRLGYNVAMDIGK
ncbi:MAG: FAD-dependent oxidoreductase [Clostridiales bacterium]|nr:FAD-dependent oxidoreductase [Clostridiales bacterium]